MKLQDGDLIFVRDNNLLSALIRNAQGDFAYSHVCSYWEFEGQGLIYTTGAKFHPFKGFLFGAVPADEYLSKREFAVGRRTDLNWTQHELRFQALRSLLGKPYGTGKLLKLAFKGRTGNEVVNQIHKKPDFVLKSAFCAEAEAFGIIKAKAPDLQGEKLTEALRGVNRKYPNKAEPCVHTPETLFDAPDTEIIYNPRG